MKQTYTLSDGKSAEIEISAELAATLAGFTRKEQNEARNNRRRNEVSIEAMKEETGWEPTDTTADIETVLIANEEKGNLLAAVARLSDKQRRLVRFYYYEEKTLREIGVIMDIHFSCVKRQLETIHKNLKNYLEKKF